MSLSCSTLFAFLLLSLLASGVLASAYPLLSSVTAGAGEASPPGTAVSVSEIPEARAVRKTMKRTRIAKILIFKMTFKINYDMI